MSGLRQECCYLWSDQIMALAVRCSIVTITDPGRADGELSYLVEALDGEAVGGWVSFF